MFKDFHDHRGECHQSVVVERGGFRFLWYRDGGGALEALSWTVTELEGGIKDGSEVRRQLGCTEFQVRSRYVVRSRCFLCVLPQGMETLG